MAYKDEYEVARLYSDGRFKEALRQQFEGNYKLSFHLSPPVIGAKDSHTGQPRKMTFGAWMMPMFSLLAKFKILRGTPLDPFSYTEDRKLERALVQRYESILDFCEENQRNDNRDIGNQLLKLPEKIRGYGHVKQHSAEIAERLENKLRIQLLAQAEPIKLFDPKAA